MANTAFYAQSRKAESMHQALRLVGLRYLTNMVGLFLLANIDDKPHELLITAMVRAKMCEQAGRLAGTPSPGIPMQRVCQCLSGSHCMGY